MNVIYIGSGFVGTCSAAVAADKGHTVLVFDIDASKIEKLRSFEKDAVESCIYENGLVDLLIKNRKQITFTSSYEDVVSFLDTCDLIFMCLPTPEIGETGESNLSFYTNAAERLAENLAIRNNGTQDKYVVIVNKSTVPIDMVKQTGKIMETHGVQNYGVVANPEFLAEGKAVEGSISPDRVVVGADNDKDFGIMREFYSWLADSLSVQYIETNPYEAAAGKLLANFYLLNKLAVCFDVAGRVCESFEKLNFENVVKIMSTDPRIGSWGFHNSLYAGGSCFSKDVRSLSHQLHSEGQNTELIDNTYLVNQRQFERFIERAKSEAEFVWGGKTVALLGLAYKANTNDTRNSSSAAIIQYALEKKVGVINVFDPVANEIFKKSFPEGSTIKYCNDERETIQSADVVIIATEWSQFRDIVSTLKDSPKKPLIMDGRRLLHQSYDDLQEAGCNIIAVGSPFLPAKQ